MYFRINNTNYTAFDGLGFSPETDLMNNSLPINEFEARLFTNADISSGQWADLYDDRHYLWAHYWLRYAERIGRDDDRQTYIVKIIGQSPIAFLERVNMPAEYIESTAYDAIMDVLDYVGDMGQSGDIIESNDVAEELEDIDIDGFAPEQSARERLLWLLMISGAYVKSYFDTTIHIDMISNTIEATIPITKTFWKPSIGFRDYVTKLKIHAYSYNQKYPDPDDNYVTDGTDYWVVTEQVISITNSNVPSGVAENEVEIDGVTLLSPSRAYAVLSSLIAFYFNRVEVSADAINNGEYTPGERVAVPVDSSQLYQGYINRCDFSFGYQARSKLNITGALLVESATLTVLYMYSSTQVARRTYLLPKGYEYTIETEYIDRTVNGHRCIFRPDSETISGTLTADATQTVSVQIALDYYTDATGDLTAITAKKNQILNWIDEMVATEKSLVNRAYKSNKSKRKKYLDQISNEERNLTNKTTNAFDKIENEFSDIAKLLHIVSVDEVDYKEETIVDPDNQTVEIS